MASPRNEGIYVRSLDSPWQCVYSDGLRAAIRRFLDDGTLLLTEAYGFTVLRIGGKVLFQGHVRGKHCIFPWAAASADGSRFTISIGRLTGVNIDVLDLGRHFAPWRVVVFDTRNHKPVGRIKLA